MIWNIRLFIFYVIGDFFEFDDITVLQIKYQSNSMVLLS